MNKFKSVVHYLKSIWLKQQNGKKSRGFKIHAHDLKKLREAKLLLENPSFAIQATNFLGSPIEAGVKKLNSAKFNHIVESSLQKALTAALMTLETKPQKASNYLHKGMVCLSGACGGFFGIATLAVELPLSTAIMFRSIADIARCEGHNLNELQTQLACMEVFALGSTKNRSDDSSDTAYYATRASLSYEINTLSKMGAKALKKAIERGEAPIIVKLITAVASRFGVTVSEKTMAQAIPVIGAVGGAGINLLFINHYQQMAKGHFIVKRLDKIYGEQMVRLAYEKITI